MRTKQTAGNSGGLVYSTQQGKMCPGCNAPVAQCACRQSQPSVSRDGIVRVGRETKGRKGSGVTVVTGAPLNDTQLTELCTRLKKRCGSGGTVKGRRYRDTG